MSQERNISLSSRNLLDGTERKNQTNYESKIGDDIASVSCNNDSEPFTVSLDDNDPSDVARRKYPHSRLYYLANHTLLLASLGISLVMAVVSFIMLYISEVESIGGTAHNVLRLLQYAGLYSFTGGIAVLVSVKTFMFIVPLKHYKARRREIVKHLIHQMVMNDVLEESFVKQYLQRLACAQETENMQKEVTLLDSSEIKELISGTYQALESSPEGLILDSLGIEKNDLQEYYQVFMMEFLIDFHKIKPSTPGNLDAKTLKKWIENIIVEKMSCIPVKSVDHKIGQILDAFLDLIVLCVTVFMSIFGLCIGAVVIFS